MRKHAHLLNKVLQLRKSAIHAWTYLGVPVGSELGEEHHRRLHHVRAVCRTAAQQASEGGYGDVFGRAKTFR